MSRASKIMLYWHTARHLRSVQVTGRLRHHLRPAYRPSIARDRLPGLRQQVGQLVTPVAMPPSMVGPKAFRFLGHAGRVATPADWNDARQAKLWLYNLHYFQDLTAQAAGERQAWHRALVAQWIADNPPGHGNGWEPYPLSIRIVNWVKWALHGNALDAATLQSLAEQAACLSRNVEWHLLGNHLLANAKALIFAGAFFEGKEAERWLQAGLDICAHEIGEQVLTDGGHFERSPMYHAIILEDVLDLVNLARCYRLRDERRAFDRLTAAVVPMRRWLKAMTHPDGEIAFFNDAAFGIAPAAGDIEAYARRLGFDALAQAQEDMLHLAASGYVRLANRPAVALLDIAPIGPDYLPGHAHADTLSFELSLGPDRVIVNGGTSEYGTGPQRQRERATAAHSTVEIDGQSSSEVWGGFRVARRAKVRDVEVARTATELCVRASHDGYVRLGRGSIHTRQWRMGAQGLHVRDHVSGSYHTAVARFHLGRGVDAQIEAGGHAGALTTPAGAKVSWRTGGVARLEPSEWHPRFGESTPVQCLVVPIEGGSLDTGFTW